MRVVVTRPEDSARRTADRLTGLGHRPIVLPVAEARHHPDTVERALDAAYSALAITSAEAVRVLSSLGASLERHLDKPLYAVGEPSARAARDAGFSDIAFGSGTGAELATIIAAAASSLRGPLLYLAGEPRSPRFEEGLRKSGVPFNTVVAYEMLPIAYERQAVDRILFEEQPEVVLLYSRENARLFFDLAGHRLTSLSDSRLLCLSENVAAAVPPELQANISVAASLDEDALLALL